MPEETPPTQPAPEEKKPEKVSAPKKEEAPSNSSPPESFGGNIDEDFDEGIKQERVKGDFTSPMAITMFIAAGIFDLAGFLFIFMLIDDFGILDISALIIVGGLMFFHARAITSAMRAQAKIVGRRVMAKTGLGAAAKASKFASLLGKDEDKIKAFAKLTIKTLIWTLLIELCPFLGSIIPTWVIAVYRHLKES